MDHGPSKSKKTVYEAKMTLMGKSGTGKTSLVRRLGLIRDSNQANQLISYEEATIGANYIHPIKRALTGEKELSLDGFDTSGSFLVKKDGFFDEQNLKILSSYFDESEADSRTLIFCFAMDDVESFEIAAEFLSTIYDPEDPLSVILMATKTDLAPEMMNYYEKPGAKEVEFDDIPGFMDVRAELHQSYLDRLSTQVDLFQVEEFAKDIQAKLILSSAKHLVPELVMSDIVEHVLAHTAPGEHVDMRPKENRTPLNSQGVKKSKPLRARAAKGKDKEDLEELPTDAPGLSDLNATAEPKPPRRRR